MQTRLVPVDLLFVPSAQTNDDAPATTLLPLVCHKHEISKWQATVQTVRRLPAATPPGVSRLSRDRLLLQSGIEQAFLAKCRGKNWIRVGMAEEDCHWWDSRSTDTLDTVVEETHRKEFYNPVLHPNCRRAGKSWLQPLPRSAGVCGKKP